MAVIHFQEVPYTAEGLLCGTNSLVVLSTANYYAYGTNMAFTGAAGNAADMALITLQSANIRFQLCGLTPSTGCGHVLVNGDVLVLDGIGQINKFKCINEGATATANLYVTYFTQ